MIVGVDSKTAVGDKTLVDDAPPPYSITVGRVTVPGPSTPIKASPNIFDIPIQADSVCVKTVGVSGWHTAGSFTMEVSDKPGPFIKVAVSTTGSQASCEAQLVQVNGSWTVEISTPGSSAWKFWQMRPKITVEVTLPAPVPNQGILVLGAFKTDLLLFTHEIGPLKGKVVFQSLKLTSSNSPISIKSLGVGSGIFKTTNSTINAVVDAEQDLELSTSNSTIKGNFSAGQSLVATTSNSTIQGKFRLVNDVKRSPTTAELNTSNSTITADFELISSTGTGGSFKVDAHTSNSRTVLAVVEAPVSSALELDVFTSNSPAEVSLHPTYQGSFSVVTSNAPATVEQDPAPQDPSGSGRNRIIQFNNKGKTNVEGHVKWSENESYQAMGRTRVGTSNAKVVLKMGTLF